MTLRDSSNFERDVVRALWVAAAAGCLHALFGGLLHLHAPPLWPFAATAVLLAFTAGAGKGRTVLVVAAFLAPIAGLTASGWGAAMLCGAVTGGALVWARREDVLEGGPADDFAGLRAVGGLGAGAVLGLVAEAAGRVFLHRLGGFGVPELAASAAATTAAALFLSLAALPALVVLGADPLGDRVRALLRDAEQTQDSRLRALLARALGAQRACAALLDALPKDAQRAELGRALTALLTGTVEQAERLAALGPDGDETRRAQETDAEAKRLEAELESTADHVTRQHLALALEVARAEHQRMAAAKVERGRLWARLEAEVALLSRARTSLEDVRGGHAAVRSAELTALSRKLTALSRSQALEADVLAEVALGAELDQLAAAQSPRTAVG